MTNQQLTLLDVPTHTPTSQWELENEDVCDHQWVPSLDQHGLFAWRCRNCWEKKKADIFKDHNRIVKSGQALKRGYQDYYLQYDRAKTDKDKKRFLTAATDRYWRARIEFLRVGIDQPLTMGDFERENPCPPELLSIYEILTQKSPLNPLGRKGDDEVMDTSENCTRGKVDDPDGTLTKITPSTNARRKKGDGSGYLFSKTVKRRNKSYLQWWFQYEERDTKGDRKKKSVYVPKNLVNQVHSMNREKLPINKILEVLGKVTTF